MNVVVLTTETLHHAYFVRELSQIYHLACVFVEKRTLRPPFESNHSFEEQREEYEQAHFWAGQPAKIRDLAPVHEVESVNDAAALTSLAGRQPEVIIVFGTGKLSSSLIQICPTGIVNLHGGDPECYRGLDSHLWAIYHRDFSGLVTTLHRLNEELDDGSIILQAPVPLGVGMRLHQLRMANTEVCVQLAISALDMYQRHRRFIARPQKQIGRYYSFMPAVLKEICWKKFAQHTASLT